MHIYIYMRLFLYVYIYAHDMQYDARFRRITLNIEILLEVEFYIHVQNNKN